MRARAQIPRGTIQTNMRQQTYREQYNVRSNRINTLPEWFLVAWNLK